MSEAEKRLKRCCFTGHRPEKLGVSEAQAVKALRAAIHDAYTSGYRTFISGMARGVDIWAAEIVLEERETHPDVHLICALPHPDFETRWKQEWQRRYVAILAKADLIKTVCPAFSMSAYQKRNESGLPQRCVDSFPACKPDQRWLRRCGPPVYLDALD